MASTPCHAKSLSFKTAPLAPRKKRQYASLEPHTPGKRLDFKEENENEAKEEAIVKECRVLESTALAYSIIRRASGAIGGNGSGGAIYGEVTTKSFQRVVDALKLHGLDCHSRFLDIGSGLGKPSFHAAQDPGCYVSVGVELELVRWQLSAHNFCQIKKTNTLSDRVYFIHADIAKARTLDPFTHIYMFDVGFPPKLLRALAGIFNASETTRCLACYQAPRRLICDYGFNVKLETRLTLSMHGSTEKHTCFVYLKDEVGPTRVDGVTVDKKISDILATDYKVDPLFADAIHLLKSPDPEALYTDIVTRLHASQNNRLLRSSSVRSTSTSSSKTTTTG